MTLQKLIENAKKQIKESKHPIIIKSDSYEFNKKILEYGKFDILLFTNLEKLKSNLRSSNAPFNNYLAKLAKKQEIFISFDLNEIRNLDIKNKALFIEKMISILRICNKNNAKIGLINSKLENNSRSFLTSIGFSKQSKIFNL